MSAALSRLEKPNVELPIHRPACRAGVPLLGHTQMNGPVSQRELRATAYRIADDIETLAHKLFRAKPMPWEKAIEQAIRQISERSG